MTADRPQSILSHLDELRWRVLKSAVAVVVLGVLALIFVDELRVILERPSWWVGPTASEWMLKPRLENMAEIRARTPGLSSTRTVSVCCIRGPRVS